jgi:hypothetical protein
MSRAVIGAGFASPRVAYALRGELLHGALRQTRSDAGDGRVQHPCDLVFYYRRAERARYSACRQAGDESGSVALGRHPVAGLRRFEDQQMTVQRAQSSLGSVTN